MTLLELKGISITLYSVSVTGYDDFNAPILAETAITVDNVLIQPSTEAEITETLNLYGKKAIYTLGIPKGDANDWENRKVQFFGENWRVIGKPVEGIEAMIPLKWNKKVKVESYVESED